MLAGHGLSRAETALLAVFVLCYLAFGVYLSWRRLGSHPGDFGVYYQAGRALLEGRSPYSVAGFLYPPPGAFLFAPFAALPFRTARIVWFVVGQLCMLGAAAGAWRWLGGGGIVLLAVGAVWGLSGPVVEENLFLGQVQPLLLALIVSALWQLDRRPRTAGMLIGCAAAVKVWPAGLLLPLIARRRRRAAGAALISTAALVAVPLLALAFRPPPLRPAPADRLFLAGSPAPLNFSLPAVVLRLTDPPRTESLPMLPTAWRQGSNPALLRLPPSRRALSVSVAVAVLVLGGAAVARTLRALPAGRGDGHVLAATISILLAALPISWFHYQLLQFPGLALLARSALRRRSTAAKLGLAGLILGLTWIGWVGAWCARLGMPMASSPVLLWLFTTATPVLSLVLAGWLLREARRDTATAG
jgi:alpha-1,2-mannosyltransferase